MYSRIAPRLPLTLLALLAAWPVLRAGMPTSGDGLIHFYRLVELDWAVRHGVLFPRWLPDLGYGYGIPLFVYYPPLAYYLAEVFRLAGLSFAHAMLAAYALAPALAAFGAYRWGRDVLGQAGGLVCAAAYAFAPYLYLDMLARGALPEALALGLLPWVFWAYRRLARGATRWNSLTAVLLLAALILTHSITALVAAPLIGLYVVVLILTQTLTLTLTPTPNPQPLIPNYQLPIAFLLLPLFLSSFFWLPALAEIKYVQAGQLFIPALDFHNHFLTLGRLLAAPQPFDPKLVFFDFPASLGWSQAALALIGLAGAARAVARRNEEGGALDVLYAGAAGLLLCWLTLPGSVRLWEGLPLLRYVQFPWRMVGPASLMLALAAGSGARAIAGWLGESGLVIRDGVAPPWGWRLGFGNWDLFIVHCSLFIVHCSFLATWLFSLPWTFSAGYERLGDPSVADIARYEQATGQLGTTSAGEYVPASVTDLPAPDSLAARYAESPVISRLDRTSLPAGAVVTGETSGLQRAEATLDSPAPFTLVFDWFYYPGWQAQIDGAPASAGPTGPHGLIAVDVPAGRHTVAIRFGPTPLRRAAGFVSLLAALALVGMVTIRREQKEMRELRGMNASQEVSPLSPFSSLASLSLLAAALLLIRAVYLDSFPNPFSHTRFDGATVAGVATPLAVNFEGRLALVGLDADRAEARSGEALDFDLYWRPLAAPLDADYSVAAHLVDADGFLVGQADSQDPGGVPTSRWRADQYALDRHRLRVLPGTPPGVYRLLVGVYRFDSGASLSVRDENDIPQGTSAAVAEVVVTRPLRPPTEAELAPAVVANETLGPLTLVGYDLDAGAQGALAGSPIFVTLYWRAAAAPLPPLLARLEVVAGDALLLDEDSSPGGPTFPTTEWAGGEAVRVAHALRLPAEAPTGPASIRLSLLDQSGSTLAGPVVIGRFDIRAPARSNDRPPIAHPVEAVFGGVIRLLGYDLEPPGLQAGQTLRLTLYWESLAPVAQSYSVFTHLLDAQARIRGQHDGLPLGGARPTTGWAPGEVLADVHEMTFDSDAPPGEYVIEAGLYEAANGARLPLLGPDGQPAGDRVVLARLPLASP